MTMRRAAVAGGLLGFAISIRADAALYLIAAAGAGWRERPLAAKRLAGAFAGLLIGAAPILFYNWIATGNPLRPTQFMEVQEILRPIHNWFYIEGRPENNDPVHAIRSSDGSCLS